MFDCLIARKKKQPNPRDCEFGCKSTAYIEVFFERGDLNILKTKGLLSESLSIGGLSTAMFFN